ncbi:MAG: hypothetical protein ACRD0X_04345 [Thermoanaerobaculia bacterium]
MKRETFCIALALVVVTAAAPAMAQVQLDGDPANGPQVLDLKPAPEATEQLFRGDLVAEIGLGCSNPTGNSGGPNDWAQGVTATLSPPFGIISTTYNIFTQVSPNITAFSFVAWAGGASPGAELGREAGFPFGAGNHTANLGTPIVVSTPQFFFGFNQPQTNVGMRIGLDTSSGSAGESFIRAPTCGVAAFLTVDSIGFPGNWVMAAVIDDTIPVELMNFDVD